MSADTPTFDLQSHSTHSDGALPPAEVVARAGRRRRRAARAVRPRHRRRRRRGGAPPRASTGSGSRPPSELSSVHGGTRTCTSSATRSTPPTRRCWPRSRTSAPTAAAASWRWPTACASSASRSTTHGARRTARADRAPAPRRRRARPPRQRRAAAREGIAARTSSSRAYLVPGATAYVARSRPTVAAGDRGHPRRRRRGGVGAPVLGRRRPGRGAAHDRALRGGGARRRRGASTPTHSREQALLLHDDVRGARAALHRLGRLPRPRARALQPLPGVRSVRAGAAARPDRNVNGGWVGVEFGPVRSRMSARPPLGGRDDTRARRAPEPSPQCPPFVTRCEPV